MHLNSLINEVDDKKIYMLRSFRLGFVIKNTAIGEVLPY